MDFLEKHLFLSEGFLDLVLRFLHFVYVHGVYHEASNAPRIIAVGYVCDVHPPESAETFVEVGFQKGVALLVGKVHGIQVETPGSLESACNSFDLSVDQSEIRFQERPSLTKSGLPSASEPMKPDSDLVCERGESRM